METLGELIRGYRTLKGLTLVELGEKTSLTHGYLSNLENNKRTKPSIEVLQKLSIALDCDYYVLMRAAGYTQAQESSIKGLKTQIDEISKSIEKFESEKEAFVNNLKLVNQDSSEYDELQIILDGMEAHLEAGHEVLGETREKLHYLEKRIEAYHVYADDKDIDKERHKITFEVPKIRLIKDKINNDIKEYIPIEEARQLFLSLESLLTMNEDIYCGNKRLTIHQRKQILEIAKIISEKEPQEKRG